MFDGLLIGDISISIYKPVKSHTLAPWNEPTMQCYTKFAMLTVECTFSCVRTNIKKYYFFVTTSSFNILIT